MSKRQYGNIRKLRSGRWQARYRDPATNRLVAATTTFPTKADAARWLALKESDVVRGVVLDRSLGEVPLRQYTEGWLDQRLLRPRTVELYRGLLKRYILPELGDTEIGSIVPGMVRAWHAELSRRDRPGPVTVAKAYRLLHAMMATAVSDELIPRNPCNLKGASVERSAERPTFTVGELGKLVSAMEPRYRVMVLLAAWCGLRLGEVMALTVADVDLERGQVVVDKAVAELSSGERVVGPPKTAAGKRVVTIPPHVVPAITAHVEEFCAPGPDSLVVVGTLGQPVRRASFYKAWERATLATGLSGRRFHDLRHTGATMAAAAGATTRELMARLGHSSPAAALRYQHASLGRDATIAKALSEMAKRTDRAVDPKGAPRRTP